jgi:GTPase SAR1 family protein
MGGLVWMDFCAYLTSPQFQVDQSKNRYHQPKQSAIFVLNSIVSKVEFLAGVLNNLIKTKKPVVLVTTKNDEANEVYVKEAERLVQRKEFKGTVMMVETSAHENINIDQAFITLAQMIDRTKGRPKVIS